MSTNSLNLSHYKELSLLIRSEFESISQKFSSFQKEQNLGCLSGCAKCCFKPEIYCSPIELLPMVIELLEKGVAESVYEECLSKQHERCLFLKVSDAEKFQGQCVEYHMRPLICRTFGVSVRHGKNDKVDVSVCQPLRDEKKAAYQRLLDLVAEKNLDLPFIDVAKNQLSALDPRFLEEEHPINQSLKIMLEKVLLYASYSQEN